MKSIKDQQGRSRYMHCILAAAPFPAARFAPISLQMFNTAFWYHYVSAASSRGNTCTHPSLADQALLAFSLPPHAFLLTLHYVFTAQKIGCVPTPQACTSPQPSWSPSYPLSIRLYLSGRELIRSELIRNELIRSELIRSELINTLIFNIKKSQLIF